ncbi:hypothetical protein, partial [Lapillicoccus sp.]|uniref:hypothetical protein n=1 Tax=Lapillicoccus sp. TaxID=1909287 RepID=UPI0025D0B392
TPAITSVNPLDAASTPPRWWPTAPGDASGREWAVVLVLVVAVVLGGVLPRPLLLVTSSDAARLATGSTTGEATP